MKIVFLIVFFFYLIMKYTSDLTTAPFDIITTYPVQDRRLSGSAPQSASEYAVISLSPVLLYFSFKSMV